jgi:hypothetical protein
MPSTFCFITGVTTAMDGTFFSVVDTVVVMAVVVVDTALVGFAGVWLSSSDCFSVMMRESIDSFHDEKLKFFTSSILGFLALDPTKPVAFDAFFPDEKRLLVFCLLSTFFRIGVEFSRFLL